jgi:hypothetical protein
MDKMPYNWGPHVILYFSFFLLPLSSPHAPNWQLRLGMPVAIRVLGLRVTVSARPRRLKLSVHVAAHRHRSHLDPCLLCAGVYQSGLVLSARFRGIE